MSLLLRKLSPKEICYVSKILTAPQIKKCHFYPEFKIGPYPKTKEEREAAAKKYNLLPEEYEPFPEDHNLGDYPKLPWESVDSRDPNYPWDIPHLQRDFMEPVHPELMILLPETLSTGRLKTPLLTGNIKYFTAMGGILLLGYLLNKVRLGFPVAEKQYPFKGEKHYTFELDYIKQ